MPGQKKKDIPATKRTSLRDRKTVSKPNRLEDPSPENTPRKKTKTTTIVVPTTYGTSTKGQPAKKRKAWLSEALFAGQNATGNLSLGPTGKMTKKTKPAGDNMRTLMPMPWHGYLDKIERPFALPWDIYSPLPKGQPKPDEWRKTRANQFVGDAKEEWQHRKPADPSQCQCRTFCDEQCLNRIMSYECDNENCRIGPDCGNRSFADLRERVKSGKKYNIGVEVVQTAGKGFGVRAARSFEPGQIIVEYSGEVITQDECHRRLENEYKTSQAYYLMKFDQAMIIDATKGSIARFINHSCAPNCTMDKWIVKGKPRMALFAGENGIMTGEELTYDYNYTEFSEEPMACLCGAPRCRGVLGPKRSKQDEKEFESKAIAMLAAATTKLKRKADDLLGGAAKRIKSSSSQSSSPKKPKGRRHTEPIPKLLKQAAGKGGRQTGAKKQSRVSSISTDRTLVDKENKTPSSRSSSTNSSGRSPAKRVDISGAQSTLRGWLKSRLEERKMITPSSVIAKVTGRGRRPAVSREEMTEEQRAALEKREQYKLAKERKLANPTPGSRGSKRLSTFDVPETPKPAAEADNDKEWKSFGKTGSKGKWTYELVPREEKKSRKSL